jgi:peptidoglycan/LPS O-acetylase OafA/YrhL
MIRERFPALDGLRGLAIVTVVLHNAAEIELAHQDRLYAHPDMWFPYAYDHLTQIGWIGVQIFFVLSGFLITRILLESKGSSTFLRDFYERRVRRIFPLYFLTLAAILVGLANLPIAPAQLVATEQHQLPLWVFLSNWFQPWGADVFGLSHFWSLAVEEQFYLVWPFVVLATGRRVLLTLSVTLCAGSLLVRAVLAALGADYEVLYNLTICRIDALVWGGIVAILCGDEASRAELRRRMSLFVPASAILFGIGAIPTRMYQTQDPATQTYGYTLLSLVVALVIARIVLAKGEASVWLLRPLEWRALRLCGKYSFAMYVFHYPIDRYLGRPLFERLAGSTAPAVWAEASYGLALLATSFVLGVVSYRLLERRFLEAPVRL